MMRSLYAGISGLRNHQTRMDVIGNNISNVNTTGFKGGRVNFQDMLSQTLQSAAGVSGGKGGTNPIQIGMGMGVASIDTLFTDGSFQSTGKQTDLAIAGQGFFVLTDGVNQVYTRAGGFDFDTVGNFLVPGTGYKVMGYKADSAGVIDTTKLVSINIPVGSTMPAKVSSAITYANNLKANATSLTIPAAAVAKALTAQGNWTTALASNSGAADTQAAVIAAEAAAQAANTAAIAAVTAPLNAVASNAIKEAVRLSQIAATLVSADATATPALKTAVVTANTSTVATLADIDVTSDAIASIPVYDTQGNAYQLNGTFEKISNNTWSFTPAKTITNSAGVTIGAVSVAPATPLATPPFTITFNSNGTFNTATAATITVTPTVAILGSGPFTMTPNFSTMTQYGSETTAAATAQDGYASGFMEKTGIDSTGTIVGKFSNGQNLALAQVALANFNNPSGLGKSGESLYVKTTNSGEPQVGTAGTNGRGNFNPGSLEMSNVDLAQQFSDMIVTQRGFQANSKIITTTDTMLEELVNLKR